MPNLLALTNLTKDFGGNKGAFEVDLTLKEGEIVGFIGPNGAGKTTTLSMITGFIKPTSGNLSLFEKPISSFSSFPAFYPQMGIMQSESSFEGDLTNLQILKRNAFLLGKNLDSKIQELADILKLELAKKFSTLSLGNKKKVNIINTLMHSPKLVILDEPTSGLDPLIQQNFLELLKKVKESGGGVLLSSHVLSEVQSICDRFLMIKEGKIVMQGNTHEILEQAFKVFRVGGLNEEMRTEIENLKLIESWKKEGEQTLLYTKKRSPLIKYLSQKNIEDVYIERPSLEEMFINKYR